MFSNTFSRIFASSPFARIQEHIEVTDACVESLLTFMQFALEQDWEQAEQERKKINQLENEADDLKRYIRSHLPKSLFMPISRDDIFELVTIQDKIANRAKDISGIVLGRKMIIPASLKSIMLEFIKTGVDAANFTKKAIFQLDDLVESGFADKYSNSLEGLIKELDEIENTADTLQIQIRAHLMEIEKDMYPVDVMFLYKIIDWIGDLSDRSLRVGNKIQILLAR